MSLTEMCRRRFAFDEYSVRRIISESQIQRRFSKKRKRSFSGHGSVENRLSEIKVLSNGAGKLSVAFFKSTRNANTFLWRKKNKSNA